MGTTLETANGATPSPDASQTVSLAVTPSQAKLLTLVDLNATLRLSLRAPSDDRSGSKPMLGEPIDLSVPAPARVAAPAAPAPAAVAPLAAPRPAAPPAQAPHRSGVEVINGDKVVQQ
jgi:Flp pilus assembly protein CpaB